MIKTVFFDAGGTLIKAPDVFLYIASQVTDEDQVELGQFLKDRFLDLYLDKSQPFRTVQELVATVLKQAANNFDVPDASGRAPEIYRSLFLNEATKFDDAIPTMDALQGMGIRMIMISDADAEILYEELENLGMMKYFEGFVVSSEVQAYKPSAAIVHKAVDLCSQPLETNVLVGDTLMDIHTADKMGVRSVHIDRRGEPIERADHVITTLTALPDIIKKLS